MLRHLTYALFTCMLIASSGLAQTFPGRMSPQEATVIADYWIRSYLRRSATPAEQQRLGDQLLNARSPAHVLSGLLASRDYYAYAGGTPYDFMRQLTEDVGHYQPSPYEVEDRLRATAGDGAQSIAYGFLRDYPRNWWPGPLATPPRELQQFYGYGAYRPRRL